MASAPLNDIIKRNYYSKYFPHFLLHRWLTYHHSFLSDAVLSSLHSQYDIESDYFLKREFSFMIKGDIYVRYKSFPTVQEFRSALDLLLPDKIDIGSVYNIPLSRRSSVAAFSPVERELIFDIDISDYANVRYCCGGDAKICRQCWPFMRCAMEVLEAGLREDFGFRNVLWVYSGRRGIHCWVCDERARRMGGAVRAAVGEYFNIYRGNDFNAFKVDLTFLSPSEPSARDAERKPNKNNKRRKKDGAGNAEEAARGKEAGVLHPHVYRSYCVCAKYFEQVFLETYRVLGPGKSGFKEELLEFLRLQGGSELEARVRGLLNAEEGAAAKSVWARIKKCLQEAQRGLLETIVLRYMYPRIDIEVSRQMNHLLKAPFSMHPATGNVCVPFKADDFDFEKDVPNVVRMMDNFDTELAKMEKAVKVFENGFLKELEEESRRKMRKIEEATKEV